MPTSNKATKQQVMIGTLRKNQRNYTDLKELANKIVDGSTTLREIAKSHPRAFLKYKRTLSKIEDIANEKKFRKWMTTCDWYFGPPGIGKSHIALENFDYNTVCTWDNSRQFKRDYCGQETVIIDDFSGEIKYSELLNLIDKWPYSIGRKNRPFLAKHIIITSLIPPHQIFQKIYAEENLDQLYRRITLYTKQKQEENWKRWNPITQSVFTE
jgi:hypothetical protein